MIHTLIQTAEGGHHIPVVDPGPADGVFSLLWLVIALPLLGAVVLLLGGRATDRWGHLLGTALPIGSFVLSLAMFVGLLGRGGVRAPGRPAAVHLVPGRRPHGRHGPALRPAVGAVPAADHRVSAR